ncbi:hypothetical protein ACIGFK_41525 [Streptomyces sp. NPDC085524]|uniref:hypothetical protein n=1 Tax=Streptomyces sp. NPDC085524 TaxID=3365728 RepID=UPI0037D77177
MTGEEAPVPDAPPTAVAVIDPDVPSDVRSLLENRKAILRSGSGLYPFSSGMFTLVKGGVPALGMGGLSLLFSPDPAAPELPAGTVAASMVSTTA